jgi:hypothetical protein
MATNYIAPDATTKIVKFTPTTPVWILVHDGKQIISFKEMSTGTLQTIQKVFVADTEAEAQAEIDSLKLVPAPVVERKGFSQPK